jgi:hypothetical protein
VTTVVDEPLEPLWRGLLVYRGLTLLSAGVVVLLTLDEFAAPVGAVVVLAVMTAWTALTAYGYLGTAAGQTGGGGSRWPISSSPSRWWPRPRSSRALRRSSRTRR